MFFLKAVQMRGISERRKARGSMHRVYVINHEAQGSMHRLLITLKHGKAFLNVHSKGVLKTVVHEPDGLTREFEAFSLRGVCFFGRSSRPPK